MEQILAELQALNAKVERIAGYLQPRPVSIKVNGEQLQKIVERHQREKGQ